MAEKAKPEEGLVKYWLSGGPRAGEAVAKVPANYLEGVTRVWHPEYGRKLTVAMYTPKPKKQ